MKKNIILYLLIILFPIEILAADFSPKNSSSNSYSNVFHTTPDKWKEPRIFHQSLGYLKGGFDKNLKISNIDLNEFNKIFSDKGSNNYKEKLTKSANNAYWYYIPEHKNKSKCRKQNCPIEMYIFNERDKIKKFTFSKIFKSSSILVEWINEKIIYIEPWLGTEGGYYILYDVEKERIIQAEAVRAGGKIFHLWREDCNKKENAKTCPQ